MAFSRVNNKSRNIRTACASSTLGNLSNNKFIRDYHELVKPYLDDDCGDDIQKTPEVGVLLNLAEQEFIHSYDGFPTCAVYAPGCLSIAGKCTNLTSSKSLSMAVQLVTLIVGKRSTDNKWYHVKTLMNEFAKDNVYKFYLNDENLSISMDEPAWIRYLKGTIQCFKAKRVYTFLEAITNTQTTNALEKTLMCYLAQKLASGPHYHHIADCLISIIGDKDKIIAFGSRSLTVNNYDFPVAVDAEMVLIEFPDFNLGELSKYRLDESCQKEMLVIKNTTPRWRTNPEGASMMKRLFSEEAMALTANILNEDKRISQMIKAIQTKRWKKLGKHLWKSYQYTRKFLDVLPDDMERVMTALESAQYVLGASITSRGSGASVFVLVQRSRFRSFISLMNSMEIPRQRYYKIKSSTGATTLYTHERHVSSTDAEPRRHYRQTLKAKYYLRDEDCVQSNNKYFEPAKSASVFVFTKDLVLTH